MISIQPEDSLFTVMVVFTTPPDEQQQAAQLIERYIADFIALQPGFVGAALHHSLDGKQLVNYAQWQSQAHFAKFSEKAKTRPELEQLMRYRPKPHFLQADRCFAPVSTS